LDLQIVQIEVNHIFEAHKTGERIYGSTNQSAP